MARIYANASVMTPSLMKLFLPQRNGGHGANLTDVPTDGPTNLRANQRTIHIPSRPVPEIDYEHPDSPLRALLLCVKTLVTCWQ